MHLMTWQVLSINPYRTGRGASRSASWAPCAPTACTIARQGLTLVHFSSQPEPLLSFKLPNTVHPRHPTTKCTPHAETWTSGSPCCKVVPLVVVPPNVAGGAK
jgi:hypothetical protein